MAVLERPSWVLAPADPEAAALAGALGVPPLVAALLRRRGAGTPEAAQAFLRPRLDDLADPLVVPGLGEAVEVLARALRAGRRIGVHGDYDVDGISATAILVRGLRALGADPVPYLPHRVRDGYGLGTAAVERLAETGVQVVVAADCGITATEAASRARALGLEVVVLDHHVPGDARPSAVIAAPAPDAEAPPCAAGLAFLCVWALRRLLGLAPARPDDLAALAALGTVADVVPLLGDNRRLAAAGLAQMRAEPPVGLRALIDDAGIDGPLDAWHIGWVLGPRLNAPGRLGDPQPSLRLLLTDDPAEARDLARQLGEANRERQAVLEQVLADAAAQAEADPAAPALVVAGRGWHPGVVGLVAGRLVEQYRRPAVAIALEGDLGRGSARSVGGFHLVEALETCRAHLRGFGGHALAAGLSIAADGIDAFRRAFCEVAAFRLAAPAPGRVEVDAEVRLEDLGTPLAAELERLAPFGAGNPHPVLAVRGVRAVARRLLGDGAHLRLGVTDGRVFVEAIGFAMAAWGELLAFVDAPVDLAFVLERDRLEPHRVRMRLRALDVPGVDLDAILADTRLLVDRLFRRAADYLDDARYGRVEDAAALYTKVVGVTFDARQAVIAQAREGDPLRLRREPANPHDPHAVQVTTEDGRAVGYLNAQLAARLAPAIDGGVRYRATVARVTGGGDRTLGLNLYLERVEDGPEASGAEARRRAWAGLQVRDALERLPVYLTGGRPLRPALAEALQAAAGGRPAVLSIAAGRGRAAAIAAGAAVAAARGARALVVAPLSRQVLHRAAQLGARLGPLGLRIVPVHGLAGVGDRERAAAALRAGLADVVVASVEALRAGGLPEAFLGRAGLAVLDGLSTVDLQALPEALAARPALIVTAASEAAAWARAVRGSLVVHDYGPRPLLRIVDRRDAADRDAAVEEVLSGGEKSVVHTVGREACVRLAVRLRERFEGQGRRVGYLHGGLPERLRQTVAGAFRDGRLDVLVATPALDEEALPGDVRQAVIARLPWNREQLLAACGSAGMDHRPAAVAMVFGGEDAGAGRRLDEEAPGRDLLAGIYRALRDRHGTGAFPWPDEATWAHLAASVPGISRAAVDAACAIFEEVGLASRESAAEATGSGPAGWLVQLLPFEGRKDLTASLRYREGLRERSAWQALAAWARAAGPQDVLRAVLA